MAKILLGATIGDARGSAGATVYSKNQFGAYIRQKVSPVQPRTPRQTQVRQQFSNMSKRWASVLTDSQRNGWLGLAAANPQPDVFGNPQILTGLQMYQLVNRNLQEIGVVIVDAAPANLAVTPLVTLTLAADSVGLTMTATFTATPLAATDLLLVSASPQLSAGRRFVKPFLRVLVASAAAQASPFNIFAAYIAAHGALVLGKRIGIGARVIRNTNGAGSPLFIATTLVV